MADSAPGNGIKTHLKDLLLLFGIPVSIVAILAGFLYIPQLFANPSYDFIYCEGYSCDRTYMVDTSGVIKFTPGDDRPTYNDAQLYYYDVARDATRALETTEALSYRVDETSKSPDGYSLRHNTGSGGFLFWDNYRNNWSLNKGIASKPVTFDNGRYREISFIGWVLKNER